MLDRDEPAREKEAYLTVLATDNGRPQLDDVCTFKVTIEDVNDNSPVFDKVVRPFFEIPIAPFRALYGSVDSSTVLISTAYVPTEYRSLASFTIYRSSIRDSTDSLVSF